MVLLPVHLPHNSIHCCKPFLSIHQLVWVFMLLKDISILQNMYIFCHKHSMSLQDRELLHSFRLFYHLHHIFDRYHKVLAKHCELDIKINLDKDKSNRMSSLVLDSSSLQDIQYNLFNLHYSKNIPQNKKLENFHKGIYKYNLQGK
jgi:hypothetical protein